MADLQRKMHARQAIRCSRWTLCGAMVLALFTCFYGLAPRTYLLASVGMGIIVFGIIIFSWRARNGLLGFFAFIFMILAQQILWHRLGSGRVFEILQGGFVLISTFSALIALLRRWLYKFASLEDHAG